MHKKLIWFGVATILVCGSLSASAAVMTGNGSWIYDGANDVYWRKNLSEFTNKTYDQQILAINSLGYGGDIGQWRMADKDDIRDLLLKYSASDISASFGKSTDENYWDGRINVASTQHSPAGELPAHFNFNLHFTTGNGYEGNGSKLESDLVTTDFNSWWSVSDSAVRGGLGAWVIADHIQQSNQNPVPEPATMILFGTGLVGLAAARRRKEAC